jgi:HTH-type transcriptional regulator, competence development regulator
VGLVTAELGEQLKSVRLVKGLTLRDVARAAEISVAYLQKLEGGAVAQPSPKVLNRLSAALDVPYDTLMVLAGYQAMVSESGAVLSSRGTKDAFASAINSTDLTKEERKAVAAFIAHLRQQRPKGQQ